MNRPRPQGEAIRPAVVFLAFPFVFFFSALLQAVTASLMPDLSPDRGLGAADFDLLAGASSFGFARLQLARGSTLDRNRPRRTCSLGLFWFLAAMVLVVIAAVARLVPHDPVILAGGLCVQWGVGLLVDVLPQRGLAEVDAFRTAPGLSDLGFAAGYFRLLRGDHQGVDNRR